MTRLLLREYPAIRGNGYSTSDVPSLTTIRNAIALKLGVSAEAIQGDSTPEEMARAKEITTYKDIEFLRSAVLQAGMIPAEQDAAYTLLGRLIQHGHSQTIRTALLLAYEGAIGAFVFEAFQTADTTKAWTFESDNLTLRPEQRIEPTTMPVAQRLGKGGTAERQIVGAKDAMMRVGRFANAFEIDEYDLINNRATQVMREQLRALMDSALAVRPDLVYAILLANVDMADGLPLFHASRGNLITADLDEAGLTLAMATLAKQKAGDRQLNLRGAYLLVPPSLERGAAKLVKEVFIEDGESTRPPVVISDSRLELGVKDPWSGTTFAGSFPNWFLVADPNQRPAVEVAFLEGDKRRPQVQSDLLLEGRFGLWADVRIHIGAKAIDPQAIVMCVPPEEE